MKFLNNDVFYLNHRLVHECIHIYKKLTERRGCISGQIFFWTILYHPFIHMYFSIFQTIKIYPLYSVEFVKSILYQATKRKLVKTLKKKKEEEEYLNSIHNKITIYKIQIQFYPFKCTQQGINRSQRLSLLFFPLIKQ